MTCRILEYLGHKTHRINHLGDWGTQFGMLTAYLFQKFPNFLEDKPEINELQVFYQVKL